MKQENLNPDNIKIFIGPARRKSSYLLSQNQKELVICAGSPLSDDYFDMVQSNIFDLLCANIPLNHIYDININTVNDDNCFSDYLKTPAGRMASLIILK
jgi:copper oxidase (laccase) domain-containing protein